MNTSLLESIQLTDLCPETDTFLDEVRDGLQQPQKAIPAKFFYDVRGSQLFDQITELPEYYLTRTEIGIMQRFVGEMVERIGPRTLLVEYGSGSSLKTRILLDHLTDPAGYFDWSPDGARIVFDTSDGIYVMNADGSDLTLLAEGSRPAWQPQPTP